MDVSPPATFRSDRTRSRKRPLGREAWVATARQALVRHGIGGVEIGKLARRLKVTRGGFYWFFESRQQLLDELLEGWKRESEAAFASIIDHHNGDGTHRYRALRERWHQAIDPQWDAAVREWARISPRVAAVVRRVDAARIEVIRRVFKELGAKPNEALVRARIAYFHEVGSRALGLHESSAERSRLASLYDRILTGRSASG